MAQPLVPLRRDLDVAVVGVARVLHDAAPARQVGGPVARVAEFPVRVALEVEALWESLVWVREPGGCGGDMAYRRGTFSAMEGAGLSTYTMIGGGARSVSRTFGSSSVGSRTHWEWLGEL